MEQSLAAEVVSYPLTDGVLFVSNYLYEDL